MRLGIFGGTFDPIHFGHLLLAETAREECRLDEVWFVPAHMAPHKLESRATAPKERLAMARLAIAGHAQFRVSDMELQRPGPSFTVDTLRQLAAERPQDELFLLVGADSLADFPTWREPAALFDLATVVAVNRGRSPASIEPVWQHLGIRRDEHFLQISMPAVDLSATDIRSRSAAGRSIRYQTPRAVELFIQQHRLYRG